MKKTIFAVVLSLFASVAAAEKINTTLFGNLAVKGYDVVAYFADAKAVKGKKSLQTEWQGANWRFSSQTNLDAFKANPEQYAPQYGGYCAYAVSQGYTASVDPAAFSIVDGKLYLNYSHSVARTWRADQENYIRLADQNWPALSAD